MTCCTANVSQSTDPTGTYQIRQDFIREIKRRFKALRGKIRTKIGYENDALHLMQDAPGGMIGNAADRERFEFSTRQDLVKKFSEWLQEQINNEVLEPVPNMAVQRIRANPTQEVVESWSHWTGSYIRAAAEVGWKSARGRLMQAGVKVGPPVEPFFKMGVPRRQLARAYARAYENLQGITSDMAQQIREDVTMGLAKGENPRKTAKRLNSTVEGITEQRAKTLARTETLESSNEQALTRYEEAGISGVAHGEWASSGLSNMCAFCRKIDGSAFTIEEMRSTAVQFRGQVYRLQPPSHPNGVCTILPELEMNEGGLDPLSERVPGTVVS